MRVFFLFIVFLLVVSSFAAHDSLRLRVSEINSLANDEKKFSQLYDLGFLYRAEDPLFSFSCATDLLHAAGEKGDTFFVARAYNLLGILYYRNQEMEKALRCHQRALQLRSVISNEAEQAASYTNLGNVYSDLENFDESEKYHLKAMSIFYHLKNKKQLLNCWCNLGILKKQEGDFVAAEGNLNQAMLMAEELKDLEAQSMCMNNLGWLYEAQKKNDQAVSCYLESVKLNERMEQLTSLSRSCFVLGRFYRITGDLTLSLQWLEKSLALADSLRSLEIMRNTLGEMAQVMHLLGKDKEAYAYLSRYHEIGDNSLAEVPDVAFNLPEIPVLNSNNSESTIQNLFVLIGILILALIFTFIWGMSYKKNRT